MCFTLNMLNIFKTEKMSTLQNLNCAGFPPDHDPRQCGWGPLGADFPGPNGTMSVEICQELVVDDQEKLLPECWSMAFSSWEWTCDCTRLIEWQCAFSLMSSISIVSRHVTTLNDKCAWTVFKLRYFKCNQPGVRVFAQIEGNNAQLRMSRQHQKAGVTGIEADLDHNTLLDAGSASAFRQAMLVLY